MGTTGATIVIVGAGLAAGTAATSLRAAGHDGPIVMFGAEQHPPYERPPLSKSYLQGKKPFSGALVHEPEWYAANGVDLRLGEEVVAVDRVAQVVRTLSGREEAYDRLLLATGATPRPVPLPDGVTTPVTTLRTVEDSDRIKASFGPGRRIVIVGAGWIGLEVAAAAREAGTDVTVLEMADLPLLRVLGPRLGQVFADLHRAHGVDLRLTHTVVADDFAGADLVLAAAGVVPNVGLAADAGLAVDNGVLVDAELRTSDPNVYAIGDIANEDHPRLGRRIRVEHWDNAIEQGKAVAGNLIGGHTAYDRLPYFYTDQYDLGMEYVGAAQPGDDVEIVGDVDGLNFRAYWVADGIVTAAMHVNDWDAIDSLRAAVGEPYASV